MSLCIEKLILICLSLWNDKNCSSMTIAKNHLGIKAKFVM